MRDLEKDSKAVRWDVTASMPADVVARLDGLTRQETAFRSWSALVEDMKRTGYVPTLPIDGEGSEARQELRGALIAEGLSAWP